MAHSVNLFVDLAFFLNERVRARDIGLGLVVIVIADEILDRIIGEKVFELPIKLSCQGLVMGKYDCGALCFFNHLGHGEGLARASCPQQNLVAIPICYGGCKLSNRAGLVACGGKFGLHDKTFAAFELFACQTIAIGAPLARGRSAWQIGHRAWRIVMHFGPSTGHTHGLCAGSILSRCAPRTSDRGLIH